MDERSNISRKGGRLTLIKASLASVPVKYLSFLVVQESVCKSLEKIRMDFLWRVGEDDRGLHLVAWERICTPKDKEGDRFTKIAAYEQGLVMQMALAVWLGGMRLMKAGSGHKVWH